ncbi:MAG: AAA family ATPase [Ramlibacter sp.]|nr:AAA family ATPase [Ramlibacter sp.]
MKIVPRRNLSSQGRIVVLNGPSSAGKSSLARALQECAPDPFLHVQLDVFRDMEPPGYFRKGQPEVSALRLAALCRAMNATCAEYARHGQNVLLDHALPAQGWRYLAEDLDSFAVLLVGVRCSLEKLEARERSRGDRPIGLAASQVLEIHAGRSYDFEVDTTARSVGDCAAAVGEWLAGLPRPTAFPEVVRQCAAV